MKILYGGLLSLFALVLWWVSAAGDGGGVASGAGLKFEAQLLRVDNNEGIAVADFDGDGHLDISAGEFWYAGPGFEEKRKLRELLPFGADYLENNGEHAVDVDGDGHVDIISGSFIPTEVYWFKNPGEGVRDAALWEKRLMADTGISQNEMTFLEDHDGNGEVSFFVNSWKDDNPMVVWRLAGEELLGEEIGTGRAGSNGHGMGFGDINGDGRPDIVFKNGWYEAPAEAGGEWTLHPDWTLVQASCPILVVDLNGDGKNDMIWGNGHDYGLYWEEQLAPDPDGTTNWKRHVIDESFSQAHALAWADLDGDGQAELITGKRVRAHSGRDPGAGDEPVVYYYKWDGENFHRHEIARGETVGIGLQIRVVDLDGDGLPEVICAGKSGTNIFWNRGF
jgi:hypothetical protein